MDGERLLRLTVGGAGQLVVEVIPVSLAAGVVKLSTLPCLHIVVIPREGAQTAAGLHCQPADLKPDRTEYFRSNTTRDYIIGTRQRTCCCCVPGPGLAGLLSFLGTSNHHYIVDIVQGSCQGEGCCYGQPVR